ncbi:FAD-dependent oxidoreductase [bacterium]|nr:FAD-dependent oxidoreductase [bacterium]
MPTQSPSVTIVGAGISGLACAYWLGQLMPGISLRLLERADRGGGIIRTYKLSEFCLETGPDCFMCLGPDFIEMCRSLGLESHLMPARSQRGVYLWDGHNPLEIIPGLQMGLTGQPWMALLCPDLSPLGKLRAALQGLIPEAADPDEGLGPYVRRRLQADFAKELPTPLSPGLFSADPHEPGLADSFPHFAVYRQEVDTRHEELTFHSFRGGMQILVDHLAETVQTNMHTGVSVRQILSGEKGWEVVSEDSRRWHSDVLVVALPRAATAGLLGSLDGPLASKLSESGSVSGACVYLGFEPTHIHLPLDGYGFVSQDLAARPVVACTWGPSQQGVLLRTYLRDIDSLSSETLIEQTLDCLRPLLAIDEAPLISHVERYHQAFPKYHVGDIAQVAELEEMRQRHPGLYWTGPAFGVAGIPACVQHARRIAEDILQSIRS